MSTERLIASEDRHFASVRLSNLVESHHRTSRLFLIPDHPARTTYEHIIRQVVDQLGLPFRPEALVREPQWQCRTPIFPRVANRLGLAFDDQGWADDMLMPNHSSDLDTYLRLYFYADSVILAPIRSAAVLESGEPIEMSLALSSDTRVLAAPIDLDEHSYRFLTTLAGPPVTLAPLTEFSIDTSHWRQTWDQ